MPTFSAPSFCSRACQQIGLSAYERIAEQVRMFPATVQCGASSVVSGETRCSGRNRWTWVGTLQFRKPGALVHRSKPKT